MKQQQSACILITGASTGIGRDAAIHWAQQGHTVIAGVRRDEDGQALKSACAGIETALLDVTNDGQIKKLWQDLSARKLAGPFHLVNNAGIAVTGPLESLSIADYRRQFEVNFFGAVQMTQTFLPLIRRTQGRIVNVSSVAGRVATPYMSPYCASKFALEGLSDSLRRELRRFGVKVILIEPGPIATPIWEKGLSNYSKVTEKFDPEIFSIYEPTFRKFVTLAEQMGKRGDPVSKVTTQMDHALFAKNPSPRYAVGFTAKTGTLVARLPTRIIDKLMAAARG